MKSKLTSLLALSFMIPPLLASSEAISPPRETVNAFHLALSSGDRGAVLELLDSAVTIFESGGAELSRDEYASHHLASDMSFAAATKMEVVEQEHQEDGDTAWVLTRSTTKGQFRESEIDALGAETMLLRRTSSGWRIVHIHWSSRSRESSH